MPDVNGSRYQLLLGPEDWEHCGPPAHEPAKLTRAWSYDPGRQAVTLIPAPFTFPPIPGEPVLTSDDRRGATRDRYGHWYWIAPDGISIRVRWSGAQHDDHYWAKSDLRACANASVASPFVPREPAQADADEPLTGLAATTGHYLCAGVKGGLLLFDLHTGGAPLQQPLPNAPDGTPTQPFDLAPLADGGLLVLDRTHKLVWLLDATFRPAALAPAPALPQLFQPQAGGAHADPAPASYQPLLLTDCTDPISVEPLPDGSLVALDRTTAQTSAIRRYLPAGAGAAASVALNQSELSEPSGGSPELAPIIAHDMAFVAAPDAPAPMIGTLFVATAGGNQAYGLRVSLEQGLTLRVEPAFYPLRKYSGKALVAPLDSAYAYYDQSARWLSLGALPRVSYPTDAMIDTPIFDGNEPNCVWHRLCLDACIPASTGIAVFSRAADIADDVKWQPWSAEPLLYHRNSGAELPYYRLWSQTELRQPTTGTWETLFQRARGRFVQVRLVLSGDGRETPTIRALRAHYPRFSYLTRYLPAVYRRDPVSADLLERFLANPEGLLTTIEGQIAAAEQFLDVRATPDEAVDWLAGWLGLAFDPAWSDYQRRLLLANAPYFFSRRGTRLGLMQAIRIAIEPDTTPEIFQDHPPEQSTAVRIVEDYERRFRPGLVLGDPSEQGQAQTPRAHRFTVLLPVTTCPQHVPFAEQLVDQIIRHEKPAHTQFSIRQYWALLRVGEARVGMDTALGPGGRFDTIRLGETALAEGVLGAAYPTDLTDRIVPA
jgi:phage tail-like protein